MRMAAKVLRLFGFDSRVILNYRHFPLYLKQRNLWLSSGGKISVHKMILHDYDDTAGVATGHYFHQDLLVARQIFEDNPKRHIDVGSRVDGFVAHVASFREIDVFDIRTLQESVHKNIKFVQADLMNVQNAEITDSLSCLHALEHFGLGRYTDRIDVDGHIKGINNIVRLVCNGGLLYISWPIGLDDAVHFNAHRVFHPESILSIPSICEQTTLIRFDYVDDYGALHLNQRVSDAVGKTEYGCGIYTFRKK